MLENIGNFSDQLVNVNPKHSSKPMASEWSDSRNMTKHFARLTFDVVGDLAFGRKWNVVNSERNRSFLDLIPDGTAGLLLVIISPEHLRYPLELTRM